MLSPRRSSLALFSVAALWAVSAVPTHAAIIDQWTFETSQPATAGPVVPETQTGSDSAIENHTTSGATYSSPAGNGSAHSWSSNRWSVGDYYEFDVTTTGAPSLFFSFDQVGSSTGPADFKVQVNTGSGFQDLAGGSYTVMNNTGSTTWTSGSAVSGTSYTFDLSSLSGVTGVRLVDTSTTATGGGTVGTTGTDRVDNVTFSTTPPAVPEPASLGILTLGAIGLLSRRRRVA